MRMSADRFLELSEAKRRGETTTPGLCPCGSEPAPGYLMCRACRDKNGLKTETKEGSDMGGKSFTRWTDAEDDVLRRNAGKGRKALVKMLGRTAGSISGRASLHGIKLGSTAPQPQEHTPWEADDIKRLKKLAEQGESMADAAKALGRTMTSVQKYASKHEIRFHGRSGPKTDSPAVSPQQRLRDAVPAEERDRPEPSTSEAEQLTEPTCDTGPGSPPPREMCEPDPAECDDCPYVGVDTEPLFNHMLGEVRRVCPDCAATEGYQEPVKEAHCSDLEECKRDLKCTPCGADPCELVLATQDEAEDGTIEPGDFNADEPTLERTCPECEAERPSNDAKRCTLCLRMAADGEDGLCEFCRTHPTFSDFRTCVSCRHENTPAVDEPCCKCQISAGGTGSSMWEQKDASEAARTDHGSVTGPSSPTTSIRVTVDVRSCREYLQLQHELADTNLRLIAATMAASDVPLSLRASIVQMADRARELLRDGDGR